ncbi:IS30 family (Tra8) [Fructobacillus fructosus]|uniref:IS30 family transposase n=1 Tax=Fructobacillus fructosus TaxID=1631 RepID=UPI002D8B02E5|nr:IS30 family (Tra8) [Fructobacillus fructosus]
MNQCCHLTSFERGRIELLHHQGRSLREIAKTIHRSPSTISRELRRGRVDDGYQAEKAQALYHTKRKRSVRQRILSNPTLRNIVINFIQVYHWSPEQIAAYLSLNHNYKISYPTIYRAIYLDNLGQKLKDHQRGIACSLRHRGKTRRRKEAQERRGRMQMPNSIHDRPIEAERRLRIGDWELDTVFGKTGGQVLMTLVDRATRRLLLGRAESKKSEDVQRTIDQLLSTLSTKELYTITPDRGKEFSKHAQIFQRYPVTFYFPDAHAPWQRGSNEKINGLIREYCPKNKDIRDDTDADLNEMVDQINNRPRKIFGWQSSNQIYQEKLFHLS